MDSETFTEMYKNTLGNKSGIYAISNNDFNKAKDYVKVGLAEKFQARFRGNEHSGYATSYPLGFQVDYLMTVPNITSMGYSGKPKKRLNVRERQVHDKLKENKVKRITKGKRGADTEWFDSKGNKSIILEKGLLPIWESTGEVSTIYKCDKSSCKPLKSRQYTTVRQEIDDKLNELPDKRRTGRERSKTKVYNPNVDGLHDKRRRMATGFM